MAGILDPKTRILDVMLTEIGRKQMNKGEFKVSYVTFSDRGAQYIDDGTGVSVPIDQLLYFETFGSADDEIIPEIDNTGDFLLSQEVSPTLEVVDGILYETTGSYDQPMAVDGYASVDLFTSMTINRFNNLQILRTETDIEDFGIIGNEFSFTHPFMSGSEGDIIELPEASGVEGLKPIRIDPRFSGNLTTLFLPPVADTSGEDVPLLAYTLYHGDLSLTGQVDEIKEKSIAEKMRVSLGTDSSYEFYNILGQIYAKRDQSIIKLLIVDGGEYMNSDGAQEARIFHAGLIWKDADSISKFSRMLSLIFHNKEEL